MSILNALQSVSLRVEHVPGTSLGDLAYVREITGRTMDDAIKALRGGDEEVTIRRVELVALTLCDKDGNTDLDIGNPEHVARVGRLDNRSLQKLFTAAAELNGLANPPEGDGN